MTDQLQRLRNALNDRYIIERQLGSGGMATVFLAKDTKHHRQVAIKVLRPELAATLGPERFLREIEIAAKLSHPHILPLYDSGDADGLLYYAMPYVVGESLRERLNREGQLPLEDALQITREVAAALSYAHSEDVIHRDIKPENIVLSAGEAVVADFGIARAVSEVGGEHLTATGLAVGTPAYMSPEQASGDRQVDGRSDTYALGCLLYEMLAGEPPFTGPTAQAILGAKVLLGGGSTSVVPSASRLAVIPPSPGSRDTALARLGRDLVITLSAALEGVGEIRRVSAQTMRAFLDGERAFADGRWRDAADAYALALEADSTFWLASMLYSYVIIAWTPPGLEVDTAVARAYTAHLSELRDPQRSWIEVSRPWFGLEYPPRQSPTWEEHLTAYGELAARFPDYWPIWFDYADELMHFGPHFGYLLADGRSAWQRTLAMNPKLVAGWEHLFLISLGRDSAVTARAVAALTRPDLAGELSPHRRLVYQYVVNEPNPALIDSVAQWYAGIVGSEQHEEFLNLTSTAGTPQAQIDISSRVLRLSPAADAVEWHRLGLALAWAARGAWDSALVALDRYVQQVPGHPAVLQAYRLAVVGAWLGAIEPGAAERWRPQAHTVAQGGEEVHWAELAWLDGVLAAARRDIEALRRARERIPASTDAATGTLERSLAALQMGIAGEQARAADALVSLEREVEFSGFQGRWAETLRQYPFVPAVNRMAVGRWLLDEGDTTRAARLLRWHETFVPRSVGYVANSANAVVTGLAYLERARIEDAWGRVEFARDYYGQFLRRYDTPVEAHRYLVEDAGLALARLAREQR